MIYRHLKPWGFIWIAGLLVLSGCGGATPTPVLPVTAPTSVPQQNPPPPVEPTIAEESPEDVPAAVGPTGSPAAGTDTAATGEGTTVVVDTPTMANPLDLPFLMKIDRISVVVGRGTLLEGRVAHGTLQASGSVEILGPQGLVASTSILAVLVSGTARDQVTVGDYAGILVESTGASEAGPGMLLSAAGAYESYEEALDELQ